jgi:protease IV
MPTKKTGCFGIALFLGFCLSMLGNLVLIGLLLSASGTPSSNVLRTAKSPRFQEQVVVDAGRDKIAIIPLEGIISYSVGGQMGMSMVEDFKAALEQAADDDRVAAVIISVDSPGGEITASDVLYNALKNFTEDKPVLVFMNAIGASGAYYTACGGNWIMCNPTTFTGSIGVIISTLNYEDLFGKIGLQSIIFKSGKFKDMLSGSREITPEERAYVQGLVMQSYDRFLGIVADNRELDAEKLRDGAADGRILSGVDALESGLVDQIGYIEEAYAKAMELGEVQDATVVRYRPSFSLANFFSIFGEGRSSGLFGFNLLPREPGIEPGRVYLLPPTFFY